MHDRRRSHVHSSSIEPVGTHDIRRFKNVGFCRRTHSDVRTSGRKMQDRA